MVVLSNNFGIVHYRQLLVYTLTHRQYTCFLILGHLDIWGDKIGQKSGHFFSSGHFG